MVKAQAERLDAAPVNQTVSRLQSRHPAERRGIRIDPPVSVPVAIYAISVATAAPSHRSIRPGMFRVARVSNGPEVWVVGCYAVGQLMQSGFPDHDGAGRGQLLTIAASVSGTKSAKIFDPEVVRMPLVDIKSLCAMGMP